MQFQIFGVLSKEIRSVILRNICLSRSVYETHYDVLELPRNCSSQEIRSAFIKLSKQYHPDRNAKDRNTHSKFVRLLEAYTVLSRADSRQNYDLSLVPINQQIRQQYGGNFTTQEQRIFKDRSFWVNRDKSKDAENMKIPYYGIKGIKKVSNTWILLLCFIFAAVGVSLQVFLINASVAFSRKALDEETQRNALVYTQVRKTALEEGNDAVLKRILFNAGLRTYPKQEEEEEEEETKEK